MDGKKLLFNADEAEEYFTMLCTSYRDTANDIFRRDNEGRHASEQIYSAEYQKYLGMQIAMREVLEYFSKFELVDHALRDQHDVPDNNVGKKSGWISVKDRLPEIGEWVLTLDEWRHIHDRKLYRFMNGLMVFTPDGLDPGKDVTHWMPLPEPPEEGTR